MTLEEMQQMAGQWHRRRFPEAQMEHVALKACEEVGEVARAVNGLVGRTSATGGGSVAAEIADVFIALFVLMDRWITEEDDYGGPGGLEVAIRIKLDLLSTVGGAHRASL